MRAIDFHVHLPTPDWLDGSMDGYVEAAEAYFRATVERQSLAELAAKYRALDVKAVLLAWDAETATSRPRVPNETVAGAIRAFPDAFTGLGSVDPHKGKAAIGPWLDRPPPNSGPLPASLLSPSSRTTSSSIAFTDSLPAI